MSSPNPIRFWCHPCDGRRATCPSCGARVRPRGASDNQAAIWNCGQYHNARFYGRGKVCSRCWRGMSQLLKGVAGSRAFVLESRYHLPAWLTFVSPTSIGQAIAADKGIVLQDDNPLTESLLLADWLDEHGHSPEADAIRVRVNLVNQGKRLLYDPLEPQLQGASQCLK